MHHKPSGHFQKVLHHHLSRGKNKLGSLGPNQVMYFPLGSVEKNAPHWFQILPGHHQAVYPEGFLA